MCKNIVFIKKRQSLKVVFIRERLGGEMKKLLLATILLILTDCGTTYYEKFQQECKRYKVINRGGRSQKADLW